MCSVRLLCGLAFTELTGSITQMSKFSDRFALLIRRPSPPTASPHHGRVRYAACRRRAGTAPRDEARPSPRRVLNRRPSPPAVTSPRSTHLVARAGDSAVRFFVNSSWSWTVPRARYFAGTRCAVTGPYKPNSKCLLQSCRTALRYYFRMILSVSSLCRRAAPQSEPLTAHSTGSCLPRAHPGMAMKSSKSYLVHPQHTHFLAPSWKRGASEWYTHTPSAFSAIL